MPEWGWQGPLTTEFGSHHYFPWMMVRTKRRPWRPILNRRKPGKAVPLSFGSNLLGEIIDISLQHSVPCRELVNFALHLLSTPKKH